MERHLVGVALLVLCVGAMNTADSDMVLMGEAPADQQSAPALPKQDPEESAKEFKLTEAQSAKVDDLLQRAARAERQALHLKKTGQRLLEQEKLEKAREGSVTLEIQGLPESPSEKLERERETEKIVEAEKAKEKQDAKQEAHLKQLAQNRLVEAGGKAGSDAGAEAGKKAAVLAAKGFIKDLEAKGEEVSDAVRKEILEEASKAGHAAGSTSGGAKALAATVRKAKAKVEAEANVLTPAEQDAANKAQKEGAQVGKEEGAKVGHQAGHAAGLAAAHQVWGRMTSHKAAAAAQETGAVAGARAGGLEGSISGREVGKSFAEDAVAKVMLEMESKTAELSEQERKLASLAALAAATKAGDHEGAKLGFELGKEAGMTVGTEIGNKDGEKAEKEAEESGRSSTVEEESVSVAEATAIPEAAEAGSIAGRDAGKHVDRDRLFEAMEKSAKEAVEAVLNGNHPALLTHVHAEAALAFTKAGYEASDIDPSVIEDAAAEGAAVYLASMKQKLSKGCTLSASQEKEITALATTAGRQMGKVVGKEAGVKATDDMIEKLKAIPDEAAHTLGTPHNAAETAKAAALTTARKVARMTSTKVASAHLKEHEDFCVACSTSPGSEGC